MVPYWERDGITLYHARCETVLPTIEPSTVALVIADPPYGIMAAERSNERRRGQNGKHRRYRMKNPEWTPIDGDDAPFDPSHLLTFPRLILFGANHYADQLPPSPSWIVWDKREEAPPDDNADAELIWTNLGGAVRTYRQCWRGFTRARDGLEPLKHLHPTQKPVNLFLWLLERYTKPGNLILDPYMGSGPVAKACQLLGRRYIGIEMVEAYVLTTIDRLAQQALPLTA